MKALRDFLINIGLILGIAIIIAAMPTERESAIYEDTLRLHILASSDSERDQRVKYEIRDLLLNEYGERLKRFTSKDAAEAELKNMTSEIREDVDRWLSDKGEEYECEVDVGVEWYDTREYEDFTLPKGYYTSLRVMLGKAEGKNWWCVMYPPLCLDIASEDAPRDDAILGYTKEEYSLITSDGYNIKFKLLEVFSDAFSKKG